MSIDLSQFHQVFFEESFEGLDVMESGLLELDPAAPDDEEINSIFRAAHSIKGGSATFGFSDVADFTHVLETLLDEVRAGTRSIGPDEVELFLQSVDCLRELLKGLQAKEDVDISRAEDLRQQFEKILGMAPSDGASLDDAESISNGAWRITFRPEGHILRTGNEPLRMFWQLAEMGTLTVTTDSSSLAAFATMNVESCYYAWELQLEGRNIQKEAIEEIFEWVCDDAELLIEPLVAEVAEADENENENESTEAIEAIEDNLQDMESADAEIIPADTKAIEPADAAPKNDAGEKAAKPTVSKAAETGSIRVDIDKIDTMINMVGELVITQSMLGQIGSDFSDDKLGKLQEGLTDLERNVQVLHESVMRVRMLPISFTLSRFPRMVRDLSRQLEKKIELVVKGENTELDKTVMEKIGDPLVHLLRNSLDHGIEKPADRVKAGKPETGIINLHAFHQGGNIIIQITDDGQGLPREKILAKARENGIVGEDEALSDEQVQDLIFQPGFSTAEKVSDVSGRGVGMDVVRRNIHALGGAVSVKSEEGVGTTFTISLPLTLAILDGQLVRVGKEVYIFPLVSIVESLSVDVSQVSSVAGACDVLRLREEYIPIIPLYEAFGIEPDSKELKNSLIVVVESDNVKVGLVVDELQAQQQVVIKSLETNYQSVEGISGATILGDGTVSLILDIAGVVKMAEGLSSELDEKAA
ncbi:MAG: chemotaxis protein CheA [Pseudomonadales bacterium]|nr:chemotaxis protein CheA [Pseudomonadales bacterium]